VKPAQQREKLVADQASLRLGIRAVGPEWEPLRAAVAVGLVAPDGEQGTDDAVLALRLDPSRDAARSDAEQHGLHLVGCCVSSGAQPVGREAVADRAKLLLGLAPAPVDYFRPEELAAEARVLFRLGAAEPMIHVKSRHLISELTEHVPQACRIGAPGDEAQHVAAGRDQISFPNVLLDALAQVRFFHLVILTAALLLLPGCGSAETVVPPVF
jgi:hypothetical protein